MARSVDKLDLAILREMSRNRVLWWGSLDPRLSAGDIADRVGVDRTTVWARLRSWERQGFLLGYEVIPNPGIFGAGLAGGDIRVDDPRAKPQVLRDLSLIEGALGAFDHVGPWVAVMYVHESRAALDRCLRLVARLPGVDEVAPCIPFRPPPCSVVPTARDWLILKVLRAAPKERLGAAAHKIGVHPRTFSRRYASLIQGKAIWSVPLLDFTQYTGAVAARLLVTLSPKAKSRLVAQKLREAYPELMLLENPEEVDFDRSAAPQGEGTFLSLLLHQESAGAIEDARKKALDLPEVLGVEMLFPRRLYIYRHWFDEHIEKALSKRKESMAS